MVITEDADTHPADAVAHVAAPLALALSAIRRDLPSLPLGLRVHAADAGSYWYALRATDTPDAIRRALAATPDRAELELLAHAIGWDDAAHAWISL